MSDIDLKAMLYGLEPDVARDAGYSDAPPRMGFFTDTSICIGCKACEVACKEWNSVPEDGINFTGMSYDNSVELGADTWRHVKFIEQPKALGNNFSGLQRAVPETVPVDLGMPSLTKPGEQLDGGDATEFRWLMASDVCKHCTHAACLDVCPTGALMRTEFGTVVVQQDICNGCGYCVPACPYGVIDKSASPTAGVCTSAHSATTGSASGLEPACAKACPTEFHPVRRRSTSCRRTADARLGSSSCTACGVDRGPALRPRTPNDGVGGDGAFFLLLDEPEVYGLPPDPIVTTRDLPAMYKHAGIAAAGLLAGVALCFVGRRP